MFKTFMIRITILCVLCGSLLSAQDNSGIQRVGRLENYWPTPANVKTMGEFAYLAAGHAGLQVVAISDTLPPVNCGYYEWGIATDLALSENHVWVSDPWGVIRSFTNGANPEMTGVFYPSDSTDGGGDLEIYGDTAWYIYRNDNHDNVIRRIDISDPTQPVQLDSLVLLDFMPPVTDFNLNGDFLYLLSGQFGIDIVDISDFEHPDYMFSLELDNPETFEIDGDYLYLSTRGEFLIFNIADPVNPQQVSNLDARLGYWNIVIDGDTVYMGGGCLQVIDVSDRTDPQVLEEGFFNRDFVGQSPNSYALNNNILIIKGALGMITIDASEPAQVARKINLRDYHVLPAVRHILTIGKIQNYLYSLEYNRAPWSVERFTTYTGLKIYDISNPENATLTGSFSISNHDEYPGELFLVDSLAIIQMRDNPIVLDISNPGQPEVIEAAFPDSVGDLDYVSENLAYYIDGRNANVITIVDFSDLENISVISRIESDHTFRFVKVYQDLLFAVMQDIPALRIYNFSDPENVFLLEQLDYSISDLYVENDKLYLVYWSHAELNTKIMDISDAGQPVELADYRQNWRIQEIVDDHAFIANEEDGFAVLDVSDLENIMVSGYYYPPPWDSRYSGYQDLVTAGNYAFVGNLSHIGIYDFSEALDIQAHDGAIPRTTLLSPAYPNPFNSTTTLTFTLPVQTHTALSIYDSSGRLVDVLLDRVTPAGMHSVVWDGGGLAAGVYVVRIGNVTTKVVRIN